MGSGYSIIWRDTFTSGEQLGTLVIDDCKVPYVEVMRSPDPATDGEVKLNLDGRFQIKVNESDLTQWGWLLANAMAVAAGYTHHGPTSERKNLFHTQVMVLDEGAGDEGE